MRLLPPSDGPFWLVGYSKSIIELFKGLMDAPFRLWPVATADLPTAADYSGGLLYDLTVSKIKFSDGANWTALSSTLGTVTSVSVVTANGISGSVANPTTTPAITLTLGAITPSSVAASGTVTGSNLSGTNTGDQTITLSGDISGSGTGAITTTIGAGKVTLAMQANMATASVVYRKTAGSGAPEVNTLATLKTDLGLTGTNSGDQTTISGNAGSATILATTRAIYGNNFDGSAALTQIIASTYGGTGNGFTKFTGPTTSEKTFTLPNASSTLLYDGGALGTPASGTLTNATGLPLTTGATAEAWSVTTPTPTPNSGAFTATGNVRVMKIGKNVFFSATVTITANGTAPAYGTTGYIDINLPYTSVNSGFNQDFAGRENAVIGFMCVGNLLNNSTILRITRYDGLVYPGGTGHVITVNGTYEAA